MIFKGHFDMSEAKVKEQSLGDNTPSRPSSYHYAAFKEVHPLILVTLDLPIIATSPHLFSHLFYLSLESSSLSIMVD
jgi:hypothetical protein